MSCYSISMFGKICTNTRVILPHRANQVSFTFWKDIFISEVRAFTRTSSYDFAFGSVYFIIASISALVVSRPKSTPRKYLILGLMNLPIDMVSSVDLVSSLRLW